MAHSPGTPGPTRSKGGRQLTSTCGTPWHMGIGQVQTVASAVARRTRATAETAVSTIWSVCGRPGGSHARSGQRAVAEAVAGGTAASLRCGSGRAIAASSPSLLAEAEVMYENLGESGGVQGRANYLGVARRCSTVPSRTWLN